MSVHDLQAPKENGASLAYPPLSSFATLVQENRARMEAWTLNIFNQPIQKLRSLARDNVLDAARQYLASGESSVAIPPHQSLFVAGHQPELFHPGVWLKNFALNGLARSQGAVPLNLVVDNDTAKNTLLPMPAGDHVAQIPFDHWQSDVPFEERRVLDEQLFRDLHRKASTVTSNWRFTPLLHDFWAEACHQAERTPLLGERFARARRTFENRWGCANAEVPLSQVCQTESFAWFACHLLSNLPRFQEMYNAVVATYRQRYHLRSRNHPVPNLARDGEWIEAPLWAWRAGQKLRERLFVRQVNTGLELRVGAASWPALRFGGGPKDVISQWQSLPAAGYKIRTRALTTTLFARVFLGDIFIHGLGGGKYDELTDEIMRRFYNIEPPGFLVLTGTLLLPFSRMNGNHEQQRRLHTLARDLWWNPQRHLGGGTGPAPELREEKEGWIKRLALSPGEKRQQFRVLRQLTSALRPFVLEQQKRTEGELELVHCRLRKEEIEGRRNYAFCLYPEDLLRPFCQSFLAGPRLGR